jgi:hypothetical protein
MRVHRFVAAFMVFWVAAGVFAFLVPFTNVGFHAAQLIPLAMAAFGIVAIRTVPGFAPEAQEALRRLGELVDASRSELRRCSCSGRSSPGWRNRPSRP